MQFEELYKSISDKATPDIEQATACVKPCFYSQYRQAGRILNTDPVIGASSFVGYKNSDSAVHCTRNESHVK